MWFKCFLSVHTDDTVITNHSMKRKMQLYVYIFVRKTNEHREFNEKVGHIRKRLQNNLIVNGKEKGTDMPALHVQYHKSSHTERRSSHRRLLEQQQQRSRGGRKKEKNLLIILVFWWYTTSFFPSSLSTSGCPLLWVDNWRCDYASNAQSQWGRLPSA